MSDSRLACLSLVTTILWLAGVATPASAATIGLTGSVLNPQVVIGGSTTLAAPPVEGAANQALVRLIASELGIPKGAVHLIAGASGRTKLLMIEGVAPETIEARWPGLRL